MKINVENLEGILLSAAVAQCEGLPIICKPVEIGEAMLADKAFFFFTKSGDLFVENFDGRAGEQWSPQSNWAQAGVIIDRYPRPLVLKHLSQFMRDHVAGLAGEFFEFEEMWVQALIANGHGSEFDRFSDKLEPDIPVQSIKY